jgi:hypothetical protein
VENIDFLHDQEVQNPASLVSPAQTLRAGHEAISQILFSIGLTVHSAQRAAVNNPKRVPEILELIRQQSSAALEQLRLLCDTP